MAPTHETTTWLRRLDAGAPDVDGHGECQPPHQTIPILLTVLSYRHPPPELAYIEGALSILFGAADYGVVLIACVHALGD